MNASHDATASLSQVEPGFVDPVFDSQAAFRAALQAMARPGTLQALPLPETHPPALFPATASLLLALCDPDTRVWLAPTLDHAAAYLRFHTGCPITTVRSEADFALIDGITGIDPIEDFRSGTEDYPDRSTTLIVQVPRLRTGAEVNSAAFDVVTSASGIPLSLSGPGIEHTARIAIGGSRREFVDQWRARRRLFPRGNDLFLVCGDSLAAIPRSTSMELDPECM